MLNLFTKRWPLARSVMASSITDVNGSFNGQALNSHDDIDASHTATATTDYSAFVGREESFSSDDSLPLRSKRTSKSRAKKSRKIEQSLKSSTKISERPLRPAQDILSRLRYDPVLSAQSFTVGYIDRHAPEPMEMPLQSWKGNDVTDEEFVPMHRVLYYKRDADGVKVWDRRERLDLIFGSGLRVHEEKEVADEQPEFSNEISRPASTDGKVRVEKRSMQDEFEPIGPIIEQR